MISKNQMVGSLTHYFRRAGSSSVTLGALSLCCAYILSSFSPVNAKEPHNHSVKDKTINSVISNSRRPEDIELMKRVERLVWVVDTAEPLGHYEPNDMFMIRLKKGDSGDIKEVYFNVLKNPQIRPFKAKKNLIYKKLPSGDKLFMSMTFKAGPEGNPACQHEHDARFEFDMDQNSPSFSYSIVNADESSCEHPASKSRKSAHGHGTGTGT